MPVLKNSRWEAFARRRVAAILQPESFVASAKAVAPGLTDRSQRDLAVELPARPEIKARIAELAEAQDQRLARIAATSTSARRTLRDIELAEFVDYLVQVLTTPLCEIDERSPLAQEITEEETKLGTRRKVKIVSRSEAAGLLAKVKGWTQEAAISINFPGFVATVRDVREVGEVARIEDGNGREAGGERTIAREVEMAPG